MAKDQLMRLVMMPLGSASDHKKDDCLSWGCLRGEIVFIVWRAALQEGNTHPRPLSSLKNLSKWWGYCFHYTEPPGLCWLDPWWHGFEVYEVGRILDKYIASLLPPQTNEFSGAPGLTALNSAQYLLLFQVWYLHRSANDLQACHFLERKRG